MKVRDAIKELMNFNLDQELVMRSSAGDHGEFLDREPVFNGCYTSGSIVIWHGEEVKNECEDGSHG